MMKRTTKTLIYSLCFISILGTFSLQKRNDSKLKTGPNNQSESQFFVDTIYSNKLKQERLLTVYLPKNFDKKKTYPVVYATDGQIISDAYVKALDSLIDKKMIPEIVFIGVHSNENWIPSMKMEYRYFEYVKQQVQNSDSLSSRFNTHFDFFVDEVFDYSQKTYSVSNLREERIFYGSSNGADFGLSLAIERPDLIGSYILCSLFQGTKDLYPWNDKNSPNFYIYYGDLEFDDVKLNAQNLEKYLKYQNIPYYLKCYEGDHERKKWENEFIKTLSMIFNKTSK